MHGLGNLFRMSVGPGGYLFLIVGGVMEKSIAVFRGKEIRKTIHNNEWWFSVSDVVKALTDSADPKQYVKKLKRGKNNI